MKKIFPILFLFPVISFSQITNSRFFIKFTDKYNSPYTIGNPSAYLSNKAIQRRANQSIAIDTTDFPVNQFYVDSIISRGGVVINRSKWFNGVVISVPDSATLLSIQTLPFVQSTLSVKRVRHIKEKHDDKFNLENSFNTLRVQPTQQTLTYSYGQSYVQVHMLNLDYLHDNGFHGEGMTIAVLDGGFYSANSLPAFDSANANGQLKGTWDFVAGNASVFEDDGHGEAVLSTIAGNMPGVLIGTAPKINYFLLRTEDVPTENIIEEYNWAAGAEYADSAGVDIISSSLGYTTFDPVMQIDSTFLPNANDHSYADMNGHTCPSSIAGNMAAQRGILVLVSAGNSGGDWWHYISAASDGDNVMSIGGVDSLGVHAGFSSYGPSSDGDIKPNVCAQAELTAVSGTDGTIVRANGTSFSCPLMAGAAACLWQAHPTMKNMEIKNAIEQTASQHSAPDSILGYGIPNFRDAHSLLSGFEEHHAPVDELNVYPNPFYNGVEIKFYSTSSSQISIELYDAVGKIILSDVEKVSAYVSNSIRIPKITTLEKGIYFLRVISKEKSFLKKIIKL